MLTRQLIEQALDNHSLFVCVDWKAKRWWRVRRNGKTQTWKKSPDRFRIPIKTGFKVYGEITNENIHSGGWRIESNGKEQT